MLSPADGQNIDSLLFRMQPEYKIIALLGLAVVIFAAPNVWWNLAVITMLFGCALSSNLSLKSLFREFRNFYKLFLIFALFCLLFTSGEVMWQWKIITLSYEGLDAAANMFMRLSALLIATSLLMLTTPAEQFAAGLEKILHPLAKVGVNIKGFVYLINYTLRFLPILTAEANSLIKSVKTIGSLKEKIKALAYLPAPLLTKALEQSTATNAELVAAEGITESGERYRWEKETTLVAALACLALTLSYIERLLPISYALPGFRLGIANIVILAGLYMLPLKKAFLLAVLKSILPAWLFGSFASCLYSLSGTLLSFGLMALLFIISRRKIPILLLSMLGALTHNIGQLLAATAILGSWQIFYYLPLLAPAGLLTGAVIGSCTAIFLKEWRKE